MTENLWALREQKRMSVATLATRAGLPIGLIMEYEAGQRSIDPRHLSRLARALYVEEADIRLSGEPRPGAPQLERTPARTEPPARPPVRPPEPQGVREPSRTEPAAPEQASRARNARGPRTGVEPKPPAPARPSQLTHLNDLMSRLGKDRAEVEAEMGKPLAEMNRLEASSLLARFQTEMRSAAIVDRRRAYLPEAVDQYELRYLTGLQASQAHVRFEMFDGRTVDGRVSGFGPYHITVVQEDGSELTLNKLALVSYRRAASGGEQTS